VLVFYGYDQGRLCKCKIRDDKADTGTGVFGNVIINQNFLDTFGTFMS